MEKQGLLRLIFGALALLSVSLVNAENPYRFYTWTVTYGTISPLGVPQQVGCLLFLFQIWLLQIFVAVYCLFKLFLCLIFFKVILINGQFPGPKLEVVTNDNIILNLFNKLDEPLLLTW